MENQIICGDSLEVLKTMPDNSVDSIVTDPPYEIGFMNRQWDKTGIAYDSSFWKECLRVLKPGGHLLAFSGTRTYHRMACAIEDAGFEIRDMIEWLYLCLSEDTEILTNRGWVCYNEIEPTDYVACFSMETGSIEWYVPESTHVFPYKGEMVRLLSDGSDQLVTPNHKVVIADGEKYRFQYAKDIDRQAQTVYVPFPKKLRALREGISCDEPITGDEEKILFKGMRQEVHGATTGIDADGATKNGASALCGVWGVGMEARVSYETVKESDVFAGMQRQTADSKGIRNAAQTLDRGAQTLATRSYEGFEELGMEGWSNRVQEARELHRGSLRAVSRGVQGNGEEGRLCDGASSRDRTGDRAMLETDGSSASHQSRPVGQSFGELRTMGGQRLPQATRARELGLFEASVSTKSLEPYEGIVWCVTVPTGAFIARRNGTVFVTGNSGFPKSMDVGKQFDKMAGAEREVIGTSPYSANRQKDIGYLGTGHNEPERLITAPATDLAKQWDGWGTALKPAHEPIVMARKPLEKTVAYNVEKYGTGAVNVDGCRIAATPEDIAIQRKRSGGVMGAEIENEVYGKGYMRVPAGNEIGRFPANCITLDADEWYSKYFNVSPQEVSKKASKRDRNSTADGQVLDGVNVHATVKPTDLMAWLIRLVTPPAGIVLDPFAGSGSTLVAAKVEGFNFIGIEREQAYVEIAQKRIGQA